MRTNNYNKKENLIVKHKIVKHKIVKHKTVKYIIAKYVIVKYFVAKFIYGCININEFMISCVKRFCKVYKEKGFGISNRINNTKGQTAIFLTIIFIGVLFFSGILVDGARIAAGKVNAVRALEDACISALALYNSQLKNEYGIFALSENNEDILRSTIETYLSSNLNIYNNLNNSIGQKEKQEYLIDLYDFKIEKLNVIPFFNLSNNTAVKKQILEHMKYRAPKQLGENILEKFKILKNAGDMACLYEKKTGLEKELSNVDNLLRELKKNISGTLGDGIFEEEYIEKFNLDGIRDKLIDTYTRLIEEQSSILSYIDEKEGLLAYLYNLAEESNIIQNTSQESSSYNEEILLKIKEAEKEYYHATEQLENVRVRISSTFEELSREYTEKFIHINEKGITNIKKLMEVGKKLSADINDLIDITSSGLTGNGNRTTGSESDNENGSDKENNNINDYKNKNENDNVDKNGYKINDESNDKNDNYNDNYNDNDKNNDNDKEKENDILKEFKGILLEDMNSLKKLIPDYEKGNNMISTLQGNMNALKSSLETLENLHHRVMTGSELNNDVRQILMEIREATDEVNAKYKTIEFSYQVWGKSENREDPRKGIATRVKEALSELVTRELNIQQKEIDFSDLPSRKKVNEPDFEEIDARDGMHQQSPDPPQQVYNGELHEIGSDIDLANTNGVFTKKVLDFISNTGKVIGNNMLDIRDDFYISQYVIDVFNSKVDKDNSTSSSTGNSISDSASNKISNSISNNISNSTNKEVESINEAEHVNKSKSIKETESIRETEDDKNHNNDEDCRDTVNSRNTRDTETVDTETADIETVNTENAGTQIERKSRISEEDKYRTSFQAEVEYILHGDQFEQINVAKAAGQIALLRFGINTLQIYMDPVKRKEAYSLATAIAGWWTGGAGIPIIANLIICSWGIIDGISDLKQLMEGEAVPVFKKSGIEFTYEDYLLLFLMLEDSDKKIDRIEDLIELNIRKNNRDFKMGNTHTAIRAEAEISMKYLFVTKAFMPAKLKTSEGRHKIRVLLYEEYL